jgi:hypothetical protein
LQKGHLLLGLQHRLLLLRQQLLQLLLPLLCSLLYVGLQLAHQVEQPPKLAGAAVCGLLVVLRGGGPLTLLVGRRTHAAWLEQWGPLRLDGSDARHELLPGQELPRALCLHTRPALRWLLLQVLLLFGPTLRLLPRWQTHRSSTLARPPALLCSAVAGRCDGREPIWQAPKAVVSRCCRLAAAAVLPLLLRACEPRVRLVLVLLLQHAVVAAMLGSIHATQAGLLCRRTSKAVVLVALRAWLPAELLLLQLSLCCKAECDQGVCSDSIVTR